MAFIDQNLVFSDGQAVTATAASTNIVDLSGGTLFSPNQTRFGEDIGIGAGVAVPKLLITPGVAFVSAGGATMVIQAQGSTDSTTWVTYAESKAYTAAQMAAGARLLPIDWPVRGPTDPMPRYIRINYTVAVSTFSAGTLFAALVLSRDDASNDADQYGSGYSVGV
jgi:hypothetical protein